MIFNNSKNISFLISKKQAQK